MLLSFHFEKQGVAGREADDVRAVAGDDEIWPGIDNALENMKLIDQQEWCFLIEIYIFKELFLFYVDSEEGKPKDFREYPNGITASLLKLR
eukprot:jgi/Bigna1/129390/aug1.9_g4098